MSRSFVSRSFVSLPANQIVAPLCSWCDAPAIRTTFVPRPGWVGLHPLDHYCGVHYGIYGARHAFGYVRRLDGPRLYKGKHRADVVPM